MTYESQGVMPCRIARTPSKKFEYCTVFLNFAGYRIRVSDIYYPANGTLVSFPVLHFYSENADFVNANLYYNERRRRKAAFICTLLFIIAIFY